MNEYLISANFAILVLYVFVFQVKFIDNSVRICVLASFVIFLFSMSGLIWYRFRYPKRKKILDDLNNKTSTKTTDKIVTVLDELIVPFAQNNARDDVRKRYQTMLSEINSEEDYMTYKQTVKKEIELLSKDLEDLKSGKKHVKLPDSEAVKFVISSFIKNAGYESRENYIIAFKKPLKEKNAKTKYIVDAITFRLRIHVFIVGCIFLCFTIILQTLIS